MQKVSHEQFVTVYIKRGGDTARMAAELGIGKAGIAQRAKKMRQAGVKLPLKRKGTGYNVQALNNLIKELKKNG